jgi:E-phenylitaconyl-CoA hydratase
MLLTGDMVDAAEAHRMGIVSRVVPLPELMPAARAIALRIAANAPLAVRALKRLVQQGMDMPLPAALEVDKYMIGLLRDTEDRLEGRRAFQEKRKPAYRGR